MVLMPKRHDRYYFTHGDVVFRVGLTLYKCHREVLSIRSPFFKKLLDVPEGAHFGNVKGNSDDHAIVLDDVNTRQFGNLLQLFYEWSAPPNGHSVEMLLGILQMSRMWDIESAKELALDELRRSNASPATKLMVADQYELIDWVEQSFEEIIAASYATSGISLFTSLSPRLLYVIAVTKEAMQERRKQMAIVVPRLGDKVGTCANHDKCVTVCPHWTTAQSNNNIKPCLLINDDGLDERSSEVLGE